MSHYYHVVPGRVRIKSPFIKGKNNVKEIEALLESIDGVQSWDINTVTGSIRVNYHSKMVTSRNIINILKKAGYFDPSKAITNDHYIHNAVSGFSHTLLSFLTVLI